MPKLREHPIEQSDLIEFLNGHSDFSFEILVLNKLIQEGFECEHGGTYEDPATKLPREFDIRAVKRCGRRFLRLAVECKNVRRHFPLLISCLPRSSKEAFHEVAVSVNPDEYYFQTSLAVPSSLDKEMYQSRNVRIKSGDSFYPEGDPVGKSCDQVGRLAQQGNQITANDSDIYPKWAQALSSADDLAYLACTEASARTGDIAMSLVLPVVVIPNNRLWVVEFDANGNRATDPRQVDRCSYFIGKEYFHSGLPSYSLTISHLEFVTVDGLIDLINKTIGSDLEREKVYPFADVYWETLPSGLSLEKARYMFAQK